MHLSQAGVLHTCCMWRFVCTQITIYGRYSYLLTSPSHHLVAITAISPSPLLFLSVHRFAPTTIYFVHSFAHRNPVLLRQSVPRARNDAGTSEEGVYNGTHYSNLHRLDAYCIVCGSMEVRLLASMFSYRSRIQWHSLWSYDSSWESATTKWSVGSARYNFTSSLTWDSTLCL
ncbi:hypothetical protein K469DRAFT_299256 [Zopfia rhizophila CBS 207.26]|uniref:Uncharacterized protein n=1 Tax=Zopfia rhizophila CBS 207.26 TaxID=1314779 RepID=A0A6A6DJR0_9PEZI|nr:hypothetical protein K469DRAFT_299256 [Zopfia rhizophila CBS 207.26]